MTGTEFTRIAKALADPHRCEILEKIAAAGELSCSALCATFSCSQATISHHLKELAVAGLLERRKQGQFGYYRFRPDVLQAYLGELQRRMLLAPARPIGHNAAPSLSSLPPAPRSTR